MSGAGLHQALVQLLGDGLAEEAGLPLAAPRDEAELLEVMRLVRAHGGRLNHDLRLSRRALGGIGPVEVRSGVVEAGAGVALERLEQELRLRELSLGPLGPSARGLDVAEYLEGPLAGLRAVPGGRLETACLALTALMPDGLRFVSRPSPRSAAGPDLDSLFLGGEGRFGLVLSATLRVFDRPRAGRAVAFTFPSTDALCSALRASLAAGVWYEQLTLAPRQERWGLWARVIGSPEGVERDLSSAGHAFTAQGGRSSGVGTPLAPGGPERELGWEDVAAALGAGRTLALWRAGLESALVAGAEAGGRPMTPGGWDDSAPLLHALGEADPHGVLGGRP